MFGFRDCYQHNALSFFCQSLFDRNYTDSNQPESAIQSHFKGFRPGKSNRSSCLVSREGKSPLRGLGNWDRLPPLRAPCRPQRWAPPSAQGGRGPCGGGPCPSPPSSPRTKQNFLCLLPSWGPLGAPTEQKPNFVQFGGLPCCWAGRLSRLWRGSPPAPSSRPPPGGGLPD